MKLLYLSLLSLLFSCSFKSEKSESQTNKGEALSIADDNDGDLISNSIERENGTHPEVADIPNVSTKFLQNYKIEINYQDKSNFLVDTKVLREDPRFRYSIGSYYVRDKTFVESAKMGKFSGASFGNINLNDFSWVKYPSIDDFYHQAIYHRYQKHKNKKIKSFKISFSNFIKLEDNFYFNSIEKIKVNFFYYSYSQKKHILLKTEELKINLGRGMNEKFDVELINPPKELLEENYLRRGEFILSSVEDYFIPKHNLHFAQLKQSILNKSIPVFSHFPDEDRIDYVAVQNKKNFYEILENLYPDSFSIEANRLNRIKSFENNLPDFKDLKELKEIDKQGNWFVLTNDFREHYLKRTFRIGDKISLAYILGSELSSQRDFQLFTALKELNGAISPKRHYIGKINENSIVELNLKINKTIGVKRHIEHGTFAHKPPSCRNCTGNRWWVKAAWQINHFSTINTRKNYKNHKYLINTVNFYINNKKININDLYNQNEADFNFYKIKGEQFLQIKLDLSTLKNYFKKGKENKAYFALGVYSSGKNGEGFQLNVVRGHKVNEYKHAAPISMLEASKRNLKIAGTSWEFNRWRGNIPWNKAVKGGFVPRIGSIKYFWESIQVDLNTIIKIHHN